MDANGTAHYSQTARVECDLFHAGFRRKSTASMSAHSHPQPLASTHRHDSAPGGPGDGRSSRADHGSGIAAGRRPHMHGMWERHRAPPT